MASTFSYRPKTYSVDELKRIAVKHKTNLNRLIEEALMEKIQNEEEDARKGSAAVLAKKITRVVAEHMGVKLVKPDRATKAKILKKARENDEKGTWIPDELARPARRH
jgi:hypothetical protein